MRPMPQKERDSWECQESRGNVWNSWECQEFLAMQNLLTGQKPNQALGQPRKGQQCLGVGGKN